jgi:hypothetical protein
VQTTGLSAFDQAEALLDELLKVSQGLQQCAIIIETASAPAAERLDMLGEILSAGASVKNMLQLYWKHVEGVSPHRLH